MQDFLFSPVRDKVDGKKIALKSRLVSGFFSASFQKFPTDIVARANPCETKWC